MGDADDFARVNNTYAQVYDNDSLIPLTSVIYTPNRRYFEQSTFYKQINSNKILAWLKKHNVVVLVYGVTAYLDQNLHTQDIYSDSRIIADIQQTSGCITTPLTCMPTIFRDDINTTQTGDDMINLIRFENSSFNYRLNAIRDRIKSVHVANYTGINYLVFGDLNEESCISKFLKSTINVNLN